MAALPDKYISIRIKSRAGLPIYQRGMFFAGFGDICRAVCQCLSGCHHIASPVRIGAGGVAGTGRTFPFLTDIFCQYRQYSGRGGELGSGAQIPAAEIKKMVSRNNRPDGACQPLVSTIWGMESAA